MLFTHKFSVTLCAYSVKVCIKQDDGCVSLYEYEIHFNEVAQNVLSSIVYH